MKRENLNQASELCHHIEHLEDQIERAELYISKLNQEDTYEIEMIQLILFDAPLSDESGESQYERHELERLNFKPVREQLIKTYEKAIQSQKYRIEALEKKLEAL